MSKLPLRVSWSMTNYCHNRCWYCINSRSLSLVIPSRDRVFRLIDRLFGYNYSSYDWYLLGGEPQSNLPFLQYVINKLLQDHRTASVNVLTTVNPQTAYADKRVRYILTIHPYTINKQPVDWQHLYEVDQVNLMLDPKHQKSTLRIYDLLIREHAISSKLRLQHIKDPQSSFTKYLEAPLLPIYAEKSPVVPNYKGYYCLQGTTCVRITPELRLSGSVCSIAGGFYPHIKKCTLDGCDCDSNDSIFKTTNYELAQQKLQEYKAVLQVCK